MKKDYSLDWNLVRTMNKTDLYKLAKRYANAYNRRVESMLASELKESYAYKKISSLLGAPYLKKYKGKSKTMKRVLVSNVTSKLSIEDLRSAVRSFEKFLTHETSTSKGLRQAKQRHYELARKYIGKSASDREAKDFLTFLGNTINATKEFAPSDTVLEAISKAYDKNNYDLDALKEEYEEFKRSNESFAEWIRHMDIDYKNQGLEFSNTMQKMGW